MDFKYIKKMEEIKCDSIFFESILANLNELEINSFKSKAISANEYRYEFIENPLSNIILVYENDEIIGLLDYWITFDSATIFRICVKEEFQKQGIASKLISLMIKDLKNTAEPISFITLEVRESNNKAINFYIKNEFNKITIKQNYYNDNENAIYMGRGL